MTKAAAHPKKHTTARQKLGQIVTQFIRIFTATLCGLAIAGAVACTGANRGTIHTKAKAPALQNVKGKAVASPTDKRGFVMPKISRHGFAHIGMVYGHGVGYPQGHPHGFTHVLNRHAHPLCVKTQPVVPKSRKGATTMHQVNPLGHTAPANSPIDPVALHIQAANALMMAKFYTQRHNHLGAKRKTTQALSALRQLAAFERVEVAHA